MPDVPDQVDNPAGEMTSGAPFSAHYTPVEPGQTGATGEPRDITFLRDVELTLTVELGRTVLPVREVLKMHRGSIIELDKLVGQPAGLYINNIQMAKGEVVVINERFGLRITKFITPDEG